MALERDTASAVALAVAALVCGLQSRNQCLGVDQLGRQCGQLAFTRALSTATASFAAVCLAVTSVRASAAAVTAVPCSVELQRSGCRWPSFSSAWAASLAVDEVLVEWVGRECSSSGVEVGLLLILESPKRRPSASSLVPTVRRLRRQLSVLAAARASAVVVDGVHSRRRPGSAWRPCQRSGR